MMFVAVSSSANQTNLSVFESTDEKVNLLEIYSSQGCSSCPPAEVWVNRWVDDERVWHSVIPLVFHVDYWDYLGWKDPFAKAAFSARQSSFKQKGYSKAVYTPGFVLNGKEWKGWFSGNRVPVESHSAGILRVELIGNDIEATYSKASTDDHLNIAVLGFGLQTYVRHGENRRTTLKQEFVVLDYKQVDYLVDGWLTTLESEIKAPSYGVVAWVSGKNDLIPKQATGGLIPNHTFEF